MPKVDCVIQYTGPTSARDYVHRIGRTARAGSSGTATIFLTPSEIDFVRMLESRRIRIKQEDMNDALGKLLGPLSRHNSVQAAATALQNDFENLILDNRQLGTKACKGECKFLQCTISYFSCTTLKCEQTRFLQHWLQAKSHITLTNQILIPSLQASNLYSQD